MFTESAELHDAIYAALKDYRNEAAWLSALLRQEHPSCRSVLDVACGTGEHVRKLVDAHGFEVDGLDVNPGFLDMAARKSPTSRFWEGDMVSFELPTRYDAVVCLFSSIGYARTLRGVEGALRSFRRHVRPDGVILVEPWFPPGILDPARVTRSTAVVGDLRVERVGRVEIQDRLSRIHFDYRLEDASGVRTAAEVHELGLFTPAEMVAAFEATGLEVRHDSTGLDGRGLYIARIAARHGRS
jgi:SAM-dependent methyltransferase